MSRNRIADGAIRKENATGSAAISASAEIIRPSKLKSVSLHLSGVATTSEDFAITLNANAGAVYDVELYALDLSSGSTVDLIWYPDEDLYLEIGDAIDVTFTNTEANTYGLQITIEELL